MPASLSPRLEVAVLPSLPPSPSFLDEVFSHPRPWSLRTEDIDLQDLPRSSTGSASSHEKGKGKQSIEDEGTADTQHSASPLEAYPPMTDDAAETRRVEETLKRWELAERRRRKVARESVHHTAGPSLLTSVTRTASLVLSGRTSIGTSAGPVGSRPFKSHDVDVAREGYVVPLDDIDNRSSFQDVAVHSPSAPLFDRNASSDTGRRRASSSGASENPFIHPSERTRPSTPTPALLAPATPTPMLPPSEPSSPSPFGDVHAQRAEQGDAATRVSVEGKTHARKRSRASQPPPATPPSRSFGLFPPTIPRHATQLQPTLRPVLRPPPREHSEERGEVRWWHDWLCGCGEGPDRGGENQAGRTNPFE